AAKLENRAKVPFVRPNPQARIAYQFDRRMQFGLTVADGQLGRKRITFATSGETNNVVVRIDGRDVFFGSTEGKWDPQSAPLPPNPGGKGCQGHKSVWVCQRISITQTVEIVPSSTGALDTCLVSYTLENKDSQPHTVGVRALVDTMIDDNDGHPFAGPDGRLITTSADFRGADVPSS